MRTIQTSGKECLPVPGPSDHRQIAVTQALDVRPWQLLQGVAVQQIHCGSSVVSNGQHTPIRAEGQLKGLIPAYPLLAGNSAKARVVEPDSAVKARRG